MTFSRLLHLARHPIYTSRLLAYRVYEIRHPDEPWIAQPAVRFCDEHLDRSSDGLEFGSGRSTAWFARRVRRLTSVEYDRQWHEKVKRQLIAGGVTNVSLLHVPLNHPREMPTERRYEVTPDYVRVAETLPDQSLGLVVVDGHYRQACVLASASKIRAGGYLLVDNSNYLPSLSDWDVPSDWPVVHESENIRTRTTIWQRPTN